MRGKEQGGRDEERGTKGEMQGQGVRGAKDMGLEVRDEG